MFNKRLITDQNIFTENRPSALPRVLLVNTILALMAGTILWAVLERNAALDHQLFSDSLKQGPNVSIGAIQVSHSQAVTTNLENLLAPQRPIAY